MATRGAVLHKKKKGGGGGGGAQAVCEIGIFFSLARGAVGLSNEKFTGPGHFFTGPTTFSLASGPGPAVKVADWGCSFAVGTISNSQCPPPPPIPPSTPTPTPLHVPTCRPRARPEAPVPERHPPREAPRSKSAGANVVRCCPAHTETLY